MALWLKLDVGILNHRKIRLIRKEPQGDSLALMWIGLLCLAMDQESEALYISEGIPYTDEDLATALDFKIKIIKTGVNLFKKYGLINILDDGAIFINSLHERQAIDKLLLQRQLGTERQRRLRARNALVTRDTEDVTRLSRVGNADVTREKKTKEVDLEEYKKESAGADPVSLPSDEDKYAAFNTPPDPEPEEPTTGNNNDKKLYSVADATFCNTVIAYLNEKTDSDFKTATVATIREINGRVRDGYGLEDFKKAIVWCHSEWKDDEKMEQYLRPATIFSQSKFPGYVENWARKKQRLENE